IPILDVLQSVPVLAFFPAAVYFFIAIARGGRIGVEAAAVFLIFTGQAWNMAFGVYEAVTTLPSDSTEATRAFGLSPWRRFRRLELPAAVPKLVYNSILSWAAGWYFLVACEIISIGKRSYSLPGLGSFIQRSMEGADIAGMFAGIGALVAIVVLLDVLVWRPLTLWAEKYRFEFTAAAVGESRVWDLYRTSGFSRALGRFWDRFWAAAGKPIERIERIPRDSPRGRLAHAAALLLRIAFLTAAGAAGVALLALIGAYLRPPIPAEAAKIPAALFFSFLRLLVAYAVSLAWTVPLALWVGENDRVARIATPVAEVAASIPATAFFPLIVFLVVRALGSVDLAAVLLVLTGMQWYILFNALAGARQVPGEMKEMTRSFGLPFRRRARVAILPAMAPSLVTGSVTGWGGGWNALILSEYVTYGHRVYEAPGIGQLLVRATVSGDTRLLVWSIVSMVVVIGLLNRFVWRRLYALASVKFRIDA
ncbi:MAG TPA: ABC transporter permease subunit, partial [Thermoanaerobaculia bacterium]|nr:ABC transporter permease subunit [Thermoanaerobaculia bacterium]